MQAPHGYRAYGLTIRSDLLLPELDADVAARPDLVIRLGIRSGVHCPLNRKVRCMNME